MTAALPQPRGAVAPVSPTVEATGETVAAFIEGQSNPELCAQHLAIVTAMARSYTRGRGFIGDLPNDDIAAVLITATARLLANPEQISTQVGPVAIRGGFTGWSLAETYVLNAYRRRAA